MNESLKKEIIPLLEEIKYLPLHEGVMYDAVRNWVRNGDWESKDGFYPPDIYSGEAIAKIINLLAKELKIEFKE